MGILRVTQARLIREKNGLQVLAWADASDASDEALAESTVRWTMMIPFAIRVHLGHPSDWTPEAQVGCDSSNARGQPA